MTTSAAYSLVGILALCADMTHEISNIHGATVQKYIRKDVIIVDELILRFVNFDFGSAIRELLSWQNELTTDPDDELRYTVLEGVKDLIIDNCTFE